ncbi:MAG TPA: NADH-quinone oxidoreductase subunit L [Acidimicrobiales bacterium]|nr:NADH-quinone oxidoreductase subunit L [Acidimicrobiales bacterium]
MLELVWLIPALPLAGFVVLTAFGRRLGEPRAGWLATVLCAGSFVAAVVVWAGLLGEHHEDRRFVQTLFEWMPVGALQVDVGFLVDPLSITMALFVTGVGALIHLYSIGYMHGDRDFSKFFVYLNLFVFSMLMLVLGSNMLVTFLGWEGVGLCSYLLISFWFTEEANASAGKKAFVTNRVGDWGFLVAIFLSFASLGTVDFLEVGREAGTLPEVTATAIGLLLFVGAVGKSAQIPLYIWLPDAMAGPTPVSALIHAATMVTGGVYLMTRVNPILAEGYGWAPDVIAWVGVVTALVAATIAVAQNDIKKVLAYSTISQLGYMFLAVGVGAYVAAIFHMVTHAFFKALLFLGAGSVIHGMHEEQDMRRMGGLSRFMPLTAGTFIVGWLAIAGVPPFSGFFSKDEILLYAWGSGGGQAKALWAIGLVTALLTAYYMSRQVYLVFFGEPRWASGPDSAVTAPAGGDPAGSAAGLGEQAAAGQPDTAADVHDAEPTGTHGRPHESPWLMTVPLVVLAGLAAVAEVLNLPFTPDLQVLEHWLEPVLGDNGLAIDVATGTKVALAVVAIVASLAGLLLAGLVYLRHRVRAVEPEVLARAWFYDGAVTRFVGGPGARAFEAVAWFDAHVVDGAVNGVAALVRGSGRRLRTVQTGFVRSYALGISAGVVVVLGYFLTRLYI